MSFHACSKVVKYTARVVCELVRGTKDLMMIIIIYSMQRAYDGRRKEKELNKRDYLVV